MHYGSLIALLLTALTLATEPAASAQCSGCPSGLSGDIRVVRIDSNGAGTPETILCAPAGTDLTINLANWSWSPDNWVIHIFDCDSATTPTHHIGHVTITGNPSNISLLAILVGSQVQTWTDISNFTLSTGCIDFGGLAISDATLRARTRASIAISGDVTRVSGSSGPDPDIHVNQIIRLQVEGRTVSGEVLGGTIDGDVIADGAAAGFYGNTSNAIAQLRAWHAIRGTVQAVDKDIFAIRVVGDPDAAVAPEGISGDILAANGRIGTIYTTGPIGRASGTRLQIIAGNTIRRIRAGYPNAVGEFTVLDKDFDFDVMSNALVAADPEAWAYTTPYSDGTLEMIQTNGDLRGTVHATNIACALAGGTGLVPDPGETPCRPGIWVKGVMYADVDIDLFVYFGNIVARSMLGEVYIGRFIKGAIVATGGATPPDPLPSGWADGRIEALSVGRDDLPEAASTNTYYAERGPGLCGVDDGNSDGPFVPTTPDDWFTAVDQDHGAIEGIIDAASSIGTADIASVSLTFNFTSGAPGCKTLAPRIEAPLIGSLTIDDFATGSVWSGVWGSGAPAVGFAEISAVQIGCMRQKASLWMRDWDSAIVTGNMFGNIVVPAVPADRSILIGGILGDERASVYSGDLATAICQCQLWNPAVCDECAASDIINEDSPRDPDYPRCSSTEDPRGQVWALASEGLQGQVVINAANTNLPQAALWTGTVQVGETGSGCPLFEISPTQSQPDLAPHYERLSADLGGGAVGLVPYALHRTDCLPAADADEEDRTFFNSAFCWISFHYGWCFYGEPGQEYDYATVDLQFYGPLVAENANTSEPENNPYVIHRVINGQEDEQGTDFAPFTTYEITGGPLGGPTRHLRIHGNVFPQLVADHYVIRPKTAVGRRLLCGGLLTSAPTPVADFSYEFALAPDCNTNGIDDADESTGYCCLAYPCDPDMNQEGNVDQDDVAYLTDVIAGGTNTSGRDPDFNRDGNVDQDDLAALINAVAGGGCP